MTFLQVLRPGPNHSLSAKAVLGKELWRPRVQAAEEASLDPREDSLGRTPAWVWTCLIWKSRTFSLQRIDPKKMFTSMWDFFFFFKPAAVHCPLVARGGRTQLWQGALVGGLLEPCPTLLALWQCEILYFKNNNNNHKTQGT